MWPSALQLLFVGLDPISSWGGAFVLIYVFSPSRLLNVCFASFGYLFYVVIRQIYLLSAKAVLGIRPPQIHREYLLYFTGFCLLTLGLITGISGRQLRKRIKINLLSVSKNLVVCIFLYLMLCTCMFIFNTTYTKTLEYLYQSMRSFRHDYLNILSTLQGYMMDNDMEGLKNYFRDSILPLNQACVPPTFVIGKLSNIKIPELKGLLYNKIIYAISLGIQVHLDIPNPVTRVSMDHVDLCRILGIYLDNATEAACQSERKQMDLLFLEETCSTFSIGNTCPSLTLPLSALAAPGTTTKGKDRGTGLYTVSQILEKYPTVLRNMSYHDNYFEQHLENL